MNAVAYLVVDGGEMPFGDVAIRSLFDDANDISHVALAALGRKAWLFAGSDRGADRAAFVATLIIAAKLNDVDPQAWLADVLARVAEIPVTKLEQLLPWNWQPAKSLSDQAA